MQKVLASQSIIERNNSNVPTAQLNEHDEKAKDLCQVVRDIHDGDTVSSYRVMQRILGFPVSEPELGMRRSNKRRMGTAF